MHREGWKKWLVEGWALLAVAVLAFAAGWLIGDLGSSPEKKTVYVATSSEEAGASEAGQAEQETAEPAGAESAGAESASGGGAQVFASNGCGSCHTLAAAGSTGTTGPDLNESLAPDDDTAGIEEMIADPNLEVIEGYPPNVMPQDYGQSLSKPEMHELAEYLVATTPAKP
jgi:mono/diheme cytochrome c family protein